MRISLVLCLALLMALPVAAAELAGVTMDDAFTVGDDELVLNGLGLRKKSMFKVYVGGLYLDSKSADADAILSSDAPRHMVMEFTYKKVSAEKLAGGWDECLEGNTPGAAADLKADFQALNGKMDEVVKGERLTFTYVPGTGTEVGVKGTSKGTIEGKDFADALFACWIGEEPATEDLKEGLLGQ